MIIRPSKEEVEEYRNIDRMNQSKLKLLLVSGLAFNTVREPELFFEEKTHFVIGGAVDDRITMGEEYFNDNYYLSVLESKPSETIKSIVQQVFQNKTSDELSGNAVQIIKACEDHQWQSNYKYDTKLKKVIEQGEDYWNELLESEDKTILSKEEWDKIEFISNNLLAHNRTTDLFLDNDHTDIYYQLPIYFEIEEIPSKALLDMVRVDHRDKIIYPYDIKTIGDYVKNFDYQCMRRRYDIQAAWYIDALKQWRDDNFPEYSILDFTFIVNSTITLESPVLFETRNLFYQAGKYGSSKIDILTIVGGHRKESPNIRWGYKKLLDIYKWHLENGFEEDYEVATSNGRFFLSHDFKRISNENSVR